MTEILSKLSSYNIFNFLFPGAVFVFCAEKMHVIPAVNEDIATKLLVYYFAGFFASRLGSVVLEPILRALRIVRYTNYSSYLLACKDDKKIELMVETSNTYRTVAAVVVCLLSARAGLDFMDRLNLTSDAKTYSILTAALALFLMSFRKQNEFVIKRVNACKPTFDIGDGRSVREEAQN